MYAQMLTPKVVASGGDFASNGGYSISSTVGEPVVQTFSSSGFYLTQGFQQPSLFIGNKREENNSGTSIQALLPIRLVSLRWLLAAAFVPVVRLAILTRSPGAGIYIS